MRRLPILLLALMLLTSVAALSQETPEATPSPTVEATPAVVATPQVSPSPTISATPTPAVSATPAPSPTPTASPEVEEADQHFATPKKSLDNFVEAMTQAGPLRPDLYIFARRHLDLSKIPTLVRDEKGITLSQQLYSILQAATIDTKKLEDYKGKTEISVYRQPSGNQVILKKQADGRWLFSAKTIEVIPDMYKVLTNKGKIETWGLAALDRTILGVNGNTWLALLLLPLVSYIFGSLFVFIMRISIGKILTNKAGVDVMRQKHVFKPLGWLLAGLVAWIGLSALHLPAWLLVVLTASIKIISSVAAIISAFRLSDAAGEYVGTLTSKTSTKFDDMLIPLARRTFKTLVGIMGILFLAQNLDIEVWSLFAGFSIFGAMVALAGQDMVKNFFGSITVLVDQPFAVDDWIVVEGIEGVVEDVGFRSTRIRTFYDSVVSLPNSRLITASVDNYGKRNYRRYSKKLPVRWSTTPEKLEAFCEGIRELVRRHPYTRKDSYQVWVNDMNEYSLQILIYIFFASPDWNTELREKHRFLIDVHRLATEIGVEFAYPSQKIFIARHEDKEEAEFDLELHDKALKQGKASTQDLLEKSLPKEKPPLQVID